MGHAKQNDSFDTCGLQVCHLGTVFLWGLVGGIVGRGERPRCCQEDLSFETLLSDYIHSFIHPLVWALQSLFLVSGGLPSLWQNNLVLRFPTSQQPDYRQ